MKVLCIGYYDKLSRFFINIEKELKKESPNLEFKIKSVFFSGFFYAITRNTKSSFISLKAWGNVLLNKKKYFDILEKKTTYKGVSLESLIHYHSKLNSNISKRSLLLQALSYIDILDIEFTNHKPDIILLYGDSRLAIETTKKLAKIYGCKTYFIEQGPFNSTFFNTHGVNANVLVEDVSTHKNDEEIKAFLEDYLTLKGLKKYYRSPILRGIDFLFQTLFQNTFVYPPDLKYIDTFPKYRKVKHKILIEQPKSPKKNFLLILQVPLDVNMIYHSPHFNNHSQIVRAIHENLPKNSTLIIREHPIYLNKYEDTLYTYAKQNNLAFDNKTPLQDALQNANAVIVNNSTVGIEALALKKATVVLGNAYYAKPDICLIYDGKTSLKTFLKSALTYKPNPIAINRFLYNLIHTNLVRGRIVDKDCIAAKHIARKIKEDKSKT